MSQHVTYAPSGYDPEHFSGGALVVADDETRTVTDYSYQGDDSWADDLEEDELIDARPWFCEPGDEVTRPYTDEENAAANEREQELERQKVDALHDLGEHSGVRKARPAAEAGCQRCADLLNAAGLS